MHGRKAELRGIIEQAEAVLLISQTSYGSRVEQALRAASRRRLLVLSVEQLAFALAPIFAGGVLILLLGTDILNSWCLLLLGLAGAAVAATRVSRRKMPVYRVAQIVDRRLQLSDSLSTACFLISQGDATESPIARLELERAAKIAAAIETSRAFPFSGGRVWALTGALATVVFGLFAVRYLVTSSLNLQHALIPLHFGAVVEQPLFAENRRTPDRTALDSRPASATPGDRQNDGRNDSVHEQETAAGQPDKAGEGQPQQRDSDSQAKSDKQQASQAGDSSAQQMAGSKAAPGMKPNPELPSKPNDDSDNGQQGSSGLLDKMKDALSSLMAKMRPNQTTGRAPQNGEHPKTDPERTAQNSAAKDQQGQQEEASNQTGDQRSGGTQAQGQATEKPQSPQGRNSGESPQNGSEAHSGIGRQDGDKLLKEAEQLRAMGKLAEIIGKRSASLTGDMMVETPSSKQQLKTAYSQRLGQHSDLGGEINRDEIPIADQQYVREYMELVRKQAKSQQ